MKTTKTTLVHIIDNNRKFLEYVVTTDETDGDATLQALAVSVAAKDCSRIVKALAQPFPLPTSLSHLKRVKNTVHKNETEKQQAEKIHIHGLLSDQQPVKRAKVESKQSETTKPFNRDLQILVGLEPLSTLLDNSTSNRKDNNNTDDGSDSPATRLVTILAGTFDINDQDSPRNILNSLLQTVTVPSKPPQSQAQADAANRLWPTTYFPLKSLEYRHQQLSLSMDQMCGMSNMMEIVQRRNERSAIVVDSSQQRLVVVSTSWDEQVLQPGTSSNPLSTPILWAIQGVSRLERCDNSHYLCTNFDLYCNYDPTIFEAMAIVHSRLGRVIFSDKQPTAGVWRNAISEYSIHSLPGTNHHLRAFKYCETEEK